MLRGKENNNNEIKDIEYYSCLIYNKGYIDLLPHIW